MTAKDRVNETILIKDYADTSRGEYNFHNL